MTTTGERVLQVALDRGAEAAELYREWGDDLVLKGQDGGVRMVRRSRTSGTALRVFRRGAVGFACTARTDADSIARLLDEALVSAALTRDDDRAALPPRTPIAEFDGVHPDLRGGNWTDRAAVVKDLERLALLATSRSAYVTEATYAERWRRVQLAATDGFIGEYERGCAQARVEVVACDEHGEQAGSSIRVATCASAVDIAACARSAAVRAATALGRAEPGGGVMAVLFDAACAVVLCSILGRFLHGDAVGAGRSPIRPVWGARLAPEAVTVVDDATLVGRQHSRPFDGEGVASQRIPLITQGRLTGLLDDTRSARRGGRTSTGSANRTRRSEPRVGMTNLVLEPGGQTVQDIVGTLDTGLQVGRIHGMHLVDPVTGTFTLAAGGRWIRRGELAGAAHRVAISADILNVLGSIEAVANDLEFATENGHVGCPSILVSDLRVLPTEGSGE